MKKITCNECNTLLFELKKGSKRKKGTICICKECWNALFNNASEYLKSELPDEFKKIFGGKI